MLVALGNAFRSFTERPHRVGGVDAHEPDWFVPVPGVKYLRNPLHPDEVRAAVRRAWPDIRAGKLDLVLLNTGWAAIQEMRPELPAIAARCHVILAENSVTEPLPSGRRRLHPANLITLTPGPGSRDGILAGIQAGQVAI